MCFAIGSVFKCDRFGIQVRSVRYSSAIGSVFKYPGCLLHKSNKLTKIKISSIYYNATSLQGGFCVVSSDLLVAVCCLNTPRKACPTLVSYGRNTVKDFRCRLRWRVLEVALLRELGDLHWSPFDSVYGCYACFVTWYCPPCHRSHTHVFLTSHYKLACDRPEA